jgi:nucleotide-binding universal stress UspA family protein
MAIDTILVAVGDEDRGRLDTMADTVIDVASPTGATAVIVHVLTEGTYRRALEEADEETTTFLERRFNERIPTQPGIEGDVPEWVRRRSPSSVDVRPEALETVLERRELIRDIAVRFAEADVAYEIRGDVGDPADRIVAMAEELDVDFVVVGSRDRSATRERLFGSVSRTVIRSVRCPVISVGTAAGE